MASLFPDDPPHPSSTPQSKASAGGSPTAPRKFPRRAKAVDAELPPLPPGWIVAQCDGGSRGNPGPAGYGAIVDDDGGLRLVELSEFLGIKTNNYAEYSGFLAVLDWALSHDHPRLRVISDSELMVKQIQGKYKVNSPDLKPLHEEARRRIVRLAEFQIHHALRHKNKDADRLANEAMDRGMGESRAPASLPSVAAEPRATPYPTPGSAPPTPASFGGMQERLGQSVQSPEKSASTPPAMLRGFVRNGVVHPLGAVRLPEGSFVKILPE